MLNTNPGNPTYGVPGGNNTVDRIFLLSITEVQQYFNNDADRIARFNGTASWWWLRSPGRYTFSATYVNIVGDIYLLG